MGFYLTGYKGFLGKVIAKKGTDVFKPLIYDRNSKLLYPQLFENKDIYNIIHCGALLECNDTKQIYKDNYLSTQRLVDFAKENRTSRIIYLSANSIGSNEIVQNRSMPQDLYNNLKYKSELYIKKNLDKEKYIIIRLPGIYIKGVKGKGFLDKVFYSQKETFNVYENILFNNIALASDIADFTIKLTMMKSMPGYIGSIGSEKPILLGDIFKTLIKFKPNLRDRINFIKSGTIEKPNNIDKVLKYGYQAQETISLLMNLYEKPSDTP